ncbi:unnamed protein product [Penicillium salamii]|nr:unnamed protein product [Penicillium salamii]CAG8225372.1 unnamed protein product [Penicillium salamii]
MLITEEWREMCLDVVETVCNEAAIRDDEFTDFHIPRCVELGYFLKYAQAVELPNFCGYGICPFEPVGYTGVATYAFPNHPTVLAIPEPDISTSREYLKERMQASIINEDLIIGTVDEDLEVLVGFDTGIGYRQEHQEWCSSYLYCRSDDESEADFQDWAWRIVVFHADGENPTPLYGRKPRFTYIPEFLDWYSTWLDYVDMDEVRDILWNPGGGHDYPLPSDEE